MIQKCVKPIDSIVNSDAFIDVKIRDYYNDLMEELCKVYGSYSKSSIVPIKVYPEMFDESLLKNLGGSKFEACENYSVGNMLLSMSLLGKGRASDLTKSIIILENAYLARNESIRSYSRASPLDTASDGLIFTVNVTNPKNGFDKFALDYLKK